MEKFGIFELLDALSAITSAEGEQQNREPAQENVQEKRMPDASFAAPSYGANGPVDPTPAAQSAFEGFLSRHDSMSKKAKK